MISTADPMGDNEVIEKYCYDNNPSNCDIYGGLYQWNETMQYTITQGVQGICPPGWHIPTDDEWKILEGTVDSQYGIGDHEWNYGSNRGFDAGKNLKSTYGWANNGNGTDNFGYTGLPAGNCSASGSGWINSHTFIWSSLYYVNNNGYYRLLFFMNNTIGKDHDQSGSDRGYSVRCLKD